MSESEDERVNLVRLKDGGILGEGILELGNVTDPNGLGDVKVRNERLFQERVSEDGALWNFTHEELDNQSPFVDGLLESGRDGRLWSLSDGLEKVVMGGGIVQLNRLDAPFLFFAVSFPPSSRE